MKEIELTCINCPLGCQMVATVEDGKVVKVVGNTCPRGKKYAETEVVAPKRTVTSTVAAGSERLCVKTVPEIDKDRIFDVMDVIHSVNANPPISIGDIVVKNIAGTGSNLVATSNVK